MKETEWKIISKKGLCEILKISANTAYHLLNSGKLEGFRVGRMWRIPLENVKNQGGYMPVTVYIEKYGEDISDAKLGAIVRKNYESYQKSIAENKEKWKAEGEQFKKARQSLNITQRELADCIGVHPLTVGKYEKGSAIRSRKMFRNAGITSMKYIQTERNKNFEKCTK